MFQSDSHLLHGVFLLRPPPLQANASTTESSRIWLWDALYRIIWRRSQWLSFSFFWYKGPYDSKLLLNVAEFVVEFMITRKGISDPLTSKVHIHQPENNLFLAHGTETERISNFPCSVSRLVFTVASNFKGLFFPCCNNIFRRTNQIKWKLVFLLWWFFSLTSRLLSASDEQEPTNPFSTASGLFSRQKYAWLELWLRFCPLKHE